MLRFFVGHTWALFSLLAEPLNDFANVSLALWCCLCGNYTGFSLLYIYPYILLTLMTVFSKLSKYLCTSSATNFTFLKAMELGNSIFANWQQAVSECSCSMLVRVNCRDLLTRPAQHIGFGYHWGYWVYCRNYNLLLSEPLSLLYLGFWVLLWKIFLTWVYRSA